MKDYPLERMMRDAKVMQIVERVNDIQRVVIADRWFALPASQRFSGSVS